MRLRLADSIRHILTQADGLLHISPERSEEFLSRLERSSIAPLAFSFYHSIVLAVEDDELEQASALFQEMMNLPPHTGGPIISELANPNQDAIASRYARFLNNDPTIEFEIFPPSHRAAEYCRKQIKDAFALMDAGDPELAAEIRALLREIVLAAGTEDPKKFTFDGASALMLWGAIIINANRSDGELAMVQMLAHESTHNLIFGLSVDEPLVENSPEELFPSPLRVDQRPMEGIYHATFVTARMHRSIYHLVQSGVLSVEQNEKARKELETNSRLFDKGIETVLNHGKLTPLGRSLMQGAQAYMASVR